MDSDDGGDAAQRRSGRVSRVPDKYLPDTAPLAVKRKRIGDEGQDLSSGDDDDDAMEGLEDEDDAISDGDDGDDDDDVHDDDHFEGAPRPSRSKKKSGGAPAVKRATKKPKLNGGSLPSRPKKSVRVTIESEANHDSELYADIFASGEDGDNVAARWYERYRENGQAAVADLVNCILSAAGCDHHITEDDVNDPDNISNRLTELQLNFEDQKITEYPLISKARTTRSFRELLQQFFHSLINVLHETEVLYTQPELMDNVCRWNISLSSSTLRPFRHTATTVALAMLAGLVDVAKKLDDRVNKMTQQVDSHRGKSKASKNGSGKSGKDARLAAFESTLQEAGANRERVGELMTEFWDTVFVHRYRDVDPRIRTECVEALGTWVWTLPSVYLDPNHLRYLGWMLSDSSPATRQEVLKQLARVFRRDASKMGHFIDRFRSRVLEMATKDVDIGVRVGAIAVVEQLKPAGLLEPDEIDSIGQLIFDSELRVRRAAVNFFADCVQEFAAAKADEIGGDEVLTEIFGRKPAKAQAADYDQPRRDWINVKSLASTLAAYEVALGEERAEPALTTLDVSAEVAHAVVPETSRLALATQVLVDKIPEITNWEVIAGYLMYDHSLDTTTTTTTTGHRNGRKPSRTADATFRAAVAPAGGEEVILLEILSAAARASLTPGGESERFRRRHNANGPESALSAAESSEQAALLLAGLIPRLLRKFGAEPATAVTVLRLQHSLNLEVFRQLRQDTATFEGLLDEICTQFTRHADTSVVSEAAAALLHARQYEELEEVVDWRVSGLWETTLNTLRNFDTTCELSVRRNLSAQLATDLSVTLYKLGKLASISDCVDVLELELNDTSAIDVLIKTVHRGKFEEADEDLDNIEDGLTANAIGAVQFYFMWKMRQLVLEVHARRPIAADEVDRVALRKRAFDQNVVHTFSSRGYNDDLRLYATGAYCDLHVLFAQLRRGAGLAQPAVMAEYVTLGRLVDQVPAGLINELLSIFASAERTFAKKTKKTLLDAADDGDDVDEPVEDDDSDSDDDDDDDVSAEEKRAAELKAERALCDLASHYVMAIAARVLDQTGAQAGRLRRRLLRNATKLGHSYKEIVAFLDEHKAAEVLAARTKRAQPRVRNRERATTTAATPMPVSAPTPGPSTPGAYLGLMPDEVLLGAPTPAADLDLDDHELQDMDAHLDDLLATPEPEEGTLEDLRRRELVDDELEEPPSEDEDKMDEESILGD